MGLKKFNAKKEIKKLKRRSKKIKKVSVIGIIIGTIFIVTSYSLYSYTKSSVAFNSTINKRVKTTVNVTNGSGGETKEGDYKVSQTFTVTPNDGYIYGSVNCTNEANPSYNTSNKTLTISNQTQDTTCTITFNETLSHRIIESNQIKINTPNFAIGEPSSSSSNTGSGLYKANDNQGESYYFRGDKTQLKNNIEFAEMDWKVIRINGDGTIRLMLHNNSLESTPFNTKNNLTSFTFNNVGHSCTNENPCQTIFNGTNFSNSSFGGTNSSTKDELETWYIDNLKRYDEKIEYGIFCNDTSAVNNFYGAYERISANHSPSLRCPNPIIDSNETLRNSGGVYKTKIGLISIDELNMAGYSMIDTIPTTSLNYLYRDYYFWTLSPWSASTMFRAANDGTFHVSDTIYSRNKVPVINLKASILYSSGEGSENNPFNV